jgi:hypothetical protein
MGGNGKMTRVWVVFHDWEDYEYHRDVIAICSSSNMAEQLMEKLEKVLVIGSWLAHDYGYAIKEVPLNEAWEDRG